MNEFWQQLLALTLTPTLVIGAVAWLLKGFIGQEFKRDLARFKGDIDRENFEKRERFSLIHQKRAEVITGVYSRLVKTRSLVADLVAIFQSGGQSLIQKKQKVAEVYNDAASYFFENKIFLPKATAEKTEALIDELKKALIEFDTAQLGNDEYKPDDSGLWIKAHGRLNENIPPILEELETQFKEILGFIEGNP